MKRIRLSATTLVVGKVQPRRTSFRVQDSNQFPFDLEDGVGETSGIDLEATTSWAPATWVHPGVFVSKPQLDFVKAKLNISAEPWTSAFKAMKSHSLASLSRYPTPFTYVECGSTSQNPGNGCHEEREDAIAAYSHALLYYFTNDTRYAEKSRSYMNAWANKIKDHTYSNAPLQTGWSAASWARAGELLRFAYSGWPSAEITKFKTMLKNVYLPKVLYGDDRTGNWDLVMNEASIGIAVFLQDKTSYDTAMNIFKGRVPAYIFLTKDGGQPKAAPGSPQDHSNNWSSLTSFWYGQTTFNTNGLAQETCRDFVHTGYGLASISHVMETSWIQGTDLYSTELGTRLRHGLGFHSGYQLGASKPSWLCPGKSLTRNMEAITEPGFNAFYFRQGILMANTQILTLQNRPAGTNWLFVAWETLTHAQNNATASVPTA
ncbi:chondroitin AC/alginate lyase [Flagelloscypha sp. PMI_526]|nr:chondroitin AC/alginate lyase [Flagelloscypha sp. PMI_526]